MNSKWLILFVVVIAIALIFFVLPNKQSPSNSYYNLANYNTSVNLVNTSSFVSSITYTPDGKYLYVAAAPNAIVINTQNNTVANRIQLLNNTEESTFNLFELLSQIGTYISPNGKDLYFTEYTLQPNAANYTLLTMSLQNDTVINQENAGVGQNPRRTGDLAVSPNGKYIYVLGQYLNILSNSNNTLSSLNSIQDPNAIAFTPDGQYAYVVYSGEYIAVLHTNNTIYSAIGDISGINYTQRPISGIAISPNGQYAYATTYAYNGTVSVISTSAQKVVDIIKVGNYPTGIAITPDGDYVYVTNWGGTISVIATINNTVVSTLGPFLQPNLITIPPNSKYAYFVQDSTYLAKISIK